MPDNLNSYSTRSGYGDRLPEEVLKESWSNDRITAGRDMQDLLQRTLVVSHKSFVGLNSRLQERDNWSRKKLP